MMSGIVSFSRRVPAGSPQMPGSSSSSSERRIARTRSSLKIITATECFTGKAIYSTLVVRSQPIAELPDVTHDLHERRTVTSICCSQPPLQIRWGRQWKKRRLDVPTRRDHAKVELYQRPRYTQASHCNLTLKCPVSQSKRHFGSVSS